jgi:hypothetical protein
MVFPENATLAMHFNPANMAVEGKFRIVDPTINAMIETGRINAVSIEQIPTLGEDCNEILCEQHGVAFIGMALLEADVTPGDPLTTNKIVRVESLLVEDGQRICKECTDFEKCSKCSHTHTTKLEKLENLVFKWTNAGAPAERSITAALERIAPEIEEANKYYKLLKTKFSN